MTQSAPSSAASPSPFTYNRRPVQPFVAPAWKLRWQGITLALPAVAYQELTVLQSQAGQLTIALRSSEDSVRVLLSQRPDEAEPVDVRRQIASLEGVELMPLRGRRRLHTDQKLAQQLFAVNTLSSEALTDLGYRYRPERLSCRLESWREDLPVAMALQKQSKLAADTGSLGRTVAVYPQVGSARGRVFRRQAAAASSFAASSFAASALPQTTWQAQIREPRNASDVLISLPKAHPSAAVGLAFGRDNWWEAPGRPDWLDALEQAIAHRQSSDWQQLAQTLEQSNFSSHSVKSAQQLAAQQSNGADSSTSANPSTSADSSTSMP